jgi:hypothetical protein
MWEEYRLTVRGKQMKVRILVIRELRKNFLWKIMDHLYVVLHENLVINICFYIVKILSLLLFLEPPQKLGASINSSQARI